MTPRSAEAALSTGAHALAQRLTANGYRMAFAYPGTSELHLCAVLASTTNIRLVNAWGDKEAAFMASGANLSRGARAVSILHGARGLTNALGAIADTRRSETPALHIVGMASRSSQPFLPPHAEQDLISAAGRLATDFFDCSTLTGFDPTQYLAVIDSAIQAVSQKPHGPILLGVSQDLLETAFVPVGIPAKAATPKQSRHLDLSQVAAVLTASNHPVILVDDYLLAAGEAGQMALGTFAQHIEAPVFQVAYRRGPMLFQVINRGNVPTFVGHYDPEDPAHRHQFDQADLLLTVEDRNMYPRVVGRLPNCKKVAVTSNPAMTLKNGYLGSGDILVECDPADLFSGLTRLLPRRLPLRSFAAQSVPTAGCRAAQRLVRTVAGILTSMEAPGLVDDSQSFGGLIARSIQAVPPKVRVFGSHGGFVGSGLPIAGGLAIASGSPTVCLLGDHGYLNSVQGLAAIASEAAPLLVIVCSNGGSHSLTLESRSRNSHDLHHQHPTASYTAMAASYGIEAYMLDWPACNASDGHLQRASDKLEHYATLMRQQWHPMLIEVRTPPADADFWTGVWRVTGYD